MCVFIAELGGVVEGALVAVDGDCVEVVVALVSEHQEVWVGIQVKTVTVGPYHWLHDRRQRNESSLMQYRLGNLKGIRSINLIKVLVLFKSLFPLFVLTGLEFLEVVSLDLLEIVIPTEHNFFTPEAHPHWVGCKHNLFDSVWTLAFEAIDKELRELEGWHDLANAGVTGAWHNDPLGMVSKTYEVIATNDRADVVKVLSELVISICLVVVLRHIVAHQHNYFRLHLLKTIEHFLKSLVMLGLVDFNLT